MLAKVGCYVVVVVADNAKFSLAVNRISHTVRKPPTLIDILSATVAQPVEHRPQILEVEAHLGQCFFTCLCPLRHMRLERSYPISVSV